MNRRGFLAGLLALPGAARLATNVEPPAPTPTPANEPKAACMSSWPADIADATCTATITVSDYATGYTITTTDGVQWTYTL